MKQNRVWRIGRLAVGIPDFPLPALYGLAREETREVPAVRLLFRVCTGNDWENEYRRGEDGFHKGMEHYRLDYDFSDRTAVFTLCPELNEVDWYFLFRDVFCVIGSCSGDALLHSSAIEHDGQAYVFCAYSGTGKSTIAHLLCDREAEIVNDEIHWVYPDSERGLVLVDQRYYRAGEPVVAGAELPVAGIYMLEQAKKCELLPIQTMEAFPVLLAAPFGGHDPALVSRAEASGRLPKQTVVQTLRFNLDAHEVRACVFGGK